MPYLNGSSLYIKQLVKTVMPREGLLAYMTELVTGLEPATSSLQMKRSTN